MIVISLIDISSERSESKLILSLLSLYFEFIDWGLGYMSDFFQTCRKKSCLRPLITSGIPLLCIE